MLKQHVIVLKPSFKNEWHVGKVWVLVSLLVPVLLLSLPECTGVLFLSLRDYLLLFLCLKSFI